MECEVCGNQIFGRGWSVVIEGARLVVCSECAKSSSKSTPQMPKQQTAATITRKSTSTVPTPRSTAPPTHARPAPRREEPIREDIELVEDYGLLVRKARESMGMTHSDLGQKIGERVSILQKLEAGKMVPDQALARRLEHALKITLLQPTPKATGEFKGKHLESTLGDIVQMKKSKAE